MTSSEGIGISPEASCDVVVDHAYSLHVGVAYGGPELTVGRTIFELWLGL